MNRTTLLDVAKMQDPDGSAAMVAEVLNEVNPILQDAPAIPSNAQMGNRVTLRSGLPTVGWTRINQGLTRTRGVTRQLNDTIGILTGLSEVDSRIPKIVGSEMFNHERFTQEKGFIEAMGQEITGTLLYGDEDTAAAEFTGLAPRMASLNTTDLTASHVRAHHSAPAGSDYTSMYIVDWHPDYCAIIYPKNSVAGLEVQDHGIQQVNDKDSNPLMCYVTEYTWMVGLTVKDPRHIARLANIDVSQALADSSTQLQHSMVRVLNAMPPKNGANRIIYCSRNILSALELQVMRQANVWLSISEYLGEKMLHFRGNPVKTLDQMSEVESLLT